MFYLSFGNLRAPDCAFPFVLLGIYGTRLSQRRRWRRTAGSSAGRAGPRKVRTGAPLLVRWDGMAAPAKITSRIFDNV